MITPDYCHDDGCTRAARMAVRITRTSRPDVRVTVYADDRTAPAVALRYCQRHGQEFVAGVINVLVDGDDE